MLRIPLITDIILVINPSVDDLSCLLIIKPIVTGPGLG